MCFTSLIRHDLAFSSQHRQTLHSVHHWVCLSVVRQMASWTSPPRRTTAQAPTKPSLASPQCLGSKGKSTGLVKPPFVSSGVMCQKQQRWGYGSLSDRAPAANTECGVEIWPEVMMWCLRYCCDIMMPNQSQAPSFADKDWFCKPTTTFVYFSPFEIWDRFTISHLQNDPVVSRSVQRYTFCTPSKNLLEVLLLTWMKQYSQS